ncbi:hypothetical protein KQ940_20370 [Marinobacterium sp. D7]|uniref:hypothetical protein n=1 Tax=Marinobacterium ramblicola TaxID=2849041 RepID=UPI001C2D8523|nr:hypothetical protein [Marinobacterium ramblicola]MBV1790420.1 hypothetical protein [Marinobacterium ramblicola]
MTQAPSYFRLFFTASAIWLAMVILAIVNGLIRDRVLVELIGQHPALVVSGLSLSLLILIATYCAFPFIGSRSRRIYLLIGLQWVSMTLLFDILFGHFFAGKSWSEILQLFNPASGDLLLLVLITTLFAPYLVARFKGTL